MKRRRGTARQQLQSTANSDREKAVEMSDWIEFNLVFFLTEMFCSNFLDTLGFDWIGLNWIELCDSHIHDGLTVFWSR